MWMPKDTATWLAIIALILVIPFNFFSTWAYPKLQDWWAARSRKSLQKRIKKLKNTLASMHDGLPMTVSEELVLLCAERLASLVYWGVNIVVFVIIIVATRDANQYRHPKLVVIFVSAAFGTYRVIRDFLMFQIRGYRRYAGPIVRMRLEQSIEALDAKLAARRQGGRDE